METYSHWNALWARALSSLQMPLRLALMHNLRDSVRAYARKYSSIVESAAHHFTIAGQLSSPVHQASRKRPFTYGMYLRHLRTRVRQTQENFVNKKYKQVQDIFLPSTRRL